MAKILLIEDESDQIELIRTRLEAHGYQVIAAENGEDGIKLAKEEKPSLILLDMILPCMHGLEVAIALKEGAETNEIPIIALTATGSPDFVKECYKEGICAYIKKPYDSKELIERIERNINIREEKHIEFDDTKKQTEIKKTVAEVCKPEVYHKIDQMLKDTLLEFGLSLKKTSDPFHGEKKIEERKKT